MRVGLAGAWTVSDDACDHEFYFSICRGACFSETQGPEQLPRGIQTVAVIVCDGPGTRQAHTITSTSVSIQLPQPPLSQPP